MGFSRQEYWSGMPLPSLDILFDHLQFALIHGPNIPGSYAILLFTASDLASITSHIHNWVLFLLWLCLFILSGVISPLISSSILGTYQLGEFIFQYPNFLPFHPVHGVLKAGKLKQYVIAFSSGPHFVRTLYHDPSILGGPTCMAHSFTELDKAVVHVIGLVIFLWLWFSVSALWWRRIRDLWKLPDEIDWLRGILVLILMGGVMLSKSLI